MNSPDILNNNQEVKSQKQILQRLNLKHSDAAACGTTNLQSADMLAGCYLARQCFELNAKLEIMLTC